MTILTERQIGIYCVLQIVLGDITEEDVDAIVNAANEHLQHGGGVAGAISRKGGPGVQKESDVIGFVPTGSAVVTGAGNLKAKHIIHAVGPVWKGGDYNEENLLASAIRTALQHATDLNLKSISFPAISSGIFGFPKVRCAEIMINTICDFVSGSDLSIHVIRCTNIDNETAEIFQSALQRIDLNKKGC